MSKISEVIARKFGEIDDLELLRERLAVEDVTVGALEPGDIVIYGGSVIHVCRVEAGPSTSMDGGYSVYSHCGRRLSGMFPGEKVQRLLRASLAPPAPGQCACGVKLEQEDDDE